MMIARMDMTGNPEQLDTVDNIIIVNSVVVYRIALNEMDRR